MVNQLAFVKHGILVQTLLCIRESNTLYLPQVKVDCVVTAIYIYISYHRDPRAGIRSLSETKAGWLSLLGGYAVTDIMHTSAFFSLPRASLLQPTHNHVCSNPRRPAITRLNFLLPLLLSSHFSVNHTGQRLRVGYLMTQAPLLVQLCIVVK